MKKFIPVTDVLVCTKNPDSINKQNSDGLINRTKIESIPTYKIKETKIFDPTKWPYHPEIGQNIVVSSTPTAINFGDGRETVYLVTPNQLLGTIISND